jgi:transposase
VSEREHLRLLLAERRSARRARLQAENQLKAALVSLDPCLGALLGGLRGTALVRSLSARRRPELAPLLGLAKRALWLADELRLIDRELAELRALLCPRLLAEDGVGPLCSAQILVSAAEPSRLRSEASFAALAGVSPLEASSGQVKRHRLNRGGDRQLNWALHMSALNRIRYHAETRDYYDRLLAGGKSKREAIRIIKRVLAPRLYRALRAADA